MAAKGTGLLAWGRKAAAVAAHGSISEGLWMALRRVGTLKYIEEKVLAFLVGPMNQKQICAAPQN